MAHKFIHSFLVLILVFGSIALPAQQVAFAAGPWYVAPTGDDNNNCLSPASPCGTINGAVGKASSGDTVYVSIGTYTGSGDEVVLLDRDITISGGWDGSFNSVNELSVVDGEHLRKGILVNNGVTAVVEGFTIQNGSAIQGGGISLSGGGVYNGGTLTMNNVVITGNTAQNGGGIANGGGDSSSIGNLTLVNTWIDGNSASDAGGGIYNYIGTLIANNTSITNNTAGDAGGGIMNYCCSGPNGGTVILNNSTVSSNSAGRGGGISNNGYFTANSSTIAGNSFSGIFGWLLTGFKEVDGI
jgi:hypothetical protein